MNLRRTKAGLLCLLVFCMGLVNFLKVSHSQTFRDQIRESIRERIQERLQGQNSPPAASGLTRQTLTYDGLERSYLFFLPSHYTPAQKTPLLLVLHGGGGFAENMSRMTPELTAYADEKNVIVVYPSGTGPLPDRLLTWNAGACCGSALDNNIDDAGFIRTLITQLQGQYNIDSRRIMAAGFSNGAMMSFRLGCELSDVLSGIGPVSGALDITCKPKEPVSVLMFNGTADQHVLYLGGQGSEQADRRHPPRTDRSVSETVAFWKQKDGCPAKGTHQVSGHIIEDAFTSCQAGTSVVLYTIEGGGHAWPGGQAYRGGAEPTQELSASKTIIDFLLSHPKQ